MYESQVIATFLACNSDFFATIVFSLYNKIKVIANF